MLVATTLACSPLLGLAGGGGGDPIFELKSTKLDKAQFWIIFAGMVFYGLLIDRVQNYVQSKVEGNRCSKMIYDRTITEFMVFGIVAITIFIGTNVDPYLDKKYPYCVTHLTFADVLVSFAACSLIVLGGLYSWMRHRTEEHLQGFEGDAHHETTIPKLGTWTPMTVKQQSVFFERHSLTLAEFNWNMYFQESLAHQICDLINITWVTWLVTFIALLPMVLYKGFVVEDPASLQAYVNGFLITTWAFGMLTLVTVLKIRQLRGKLYRSVDGYLRERRPAEMDADSEDESVSQLEEVEEDMHWWSEFLAGLMQFESLIVCFLLGMYVMHLSYNLKTYKAEMGAAVWMYHVGFLVPLLVSLVVLFPLGLVELTSIQAFTTPDMEMLHTICDEVRQAHMDLCLIRDRILSHPSSKMGPGAIEWAKEKLLEENGDHTITRSDMQRVLLAIDVRLPMERALKVFDLVDQEHEARDNEEKSFMLKVKNCCEDTVDHQVPIDDLLDSAFKAQMDGRRA